jgi:hypothetical protein
MVQVLFLWEDIKKEWNVVFTKVPYVSGKNLASYMEWAQTEEQSLPLYVLEDLAHTGLEILGLKLEKREKWKGIIQVGHNIGRDNIMIRWITNGIIDIVITDIGLDIWEALVAEENISASLK